MISIETFRFEEENDFGNEILEDVSINNEYEYENDLKPYS